MKIRWILCALTLAASLSAVACSKKEACTPLPVPEAGKDLVLDTGVVCKDKGSVMSVDYPKEKKWQDVEARYKSELAAKGWKVNAGKSDGMLIAAKGSKTVLIVLLDNKDRGVPTAVVTY